MPCLLPSSPQPSHKPSHTHPLQLSFPSEITQKLLQNKAISVKILFLGHSQKRDRLPRKSPISRPSTSFQKPTTRTHQTSKTAPIQPHFTFVNPDHSFSPGSKTTFSKYPFFLFQFQAHPCPSLPPPCPACCFPALNPLTPMPTPCKYFSPSKLLRNYSKTKPFPSKSSFFPGAKPPFQNTFFFLFQFQAHPCPSLPPPCPVCCLPALNPLTPIPTPCNYLSLPKLLKNYFRTKPPPSKSSFFPSTLPYQNTPIPKHPHTKTLRIPKHPQTYTSLKPLLKAFHLHSPHNPPSSYVPSSQSCNPHNLTTLQSFILTILHPHNLTILHNPLSPPILQLYNPAILINSSSLQSSSILQSCNPHQFHNPAILTLHPTILHPHNLTILTLHPHNLTTLQSSQSYNFTILTILQLHNPHNLTTSQSSPFILFRTILTILQSYNPTILQSYNPAISHNPAIPLSSQYISQP